MSGAIEDCLDKFGLALGKVFRDEIAAARAELEELTRKAEAWDAIDPPSKSFRECVEEINASRKDATDA